MILLEADNSVILEALRSKLTTSSGSIPDNNTQSSSLATLDVHFSDHSQAQFRLYCRERRELRLALRMPAWADVERHGLVEQVKRTYGELWAESADSDYDVTLCVSLDAVTDATVRKFAALRKTILAAPLQHAIAIQTQNDKTTAGSSAFTLSLGGDDSMTVAPVSDHIVVVFSTSFPDASDVILARVFLQEFHDIRQGHGLQDAPAVLFGKEPPQDVAHLFPPARTTDLNYITFVLFPRHYATPSQIDHLLDTLPSFRDYLHYHIKCSKAYLHQRMRAKTADFLKILNRAKPENF